MKDIKGVFRNLENLIRGSRWFEDDWEIYNSGAYLQLYKKNWHNENQGGIHFETYIGDSQIKKKSFPILMHAEEDCPNQATFIKKFLELEQERISKWKDYKIKGSGYTIFQRTLPLNFKNLEQRILQELSEIRQLESGVDKTLGEI